MSNSFNAPTRGNNDNISTHCASYVMYKDMVYYMLLRGDEIQEKVHFSTLCSCAYANRSIKVDK